MNFKKKYTVIYWCTKSTLRCTRSTLVLINNFWEKGTISTPQNVKLALISIHRLIIARWINNRAIPCFRPLAPRVRFFVCARRRGGIKFRLANVRLGLGGQGRSLPGSANVSHTAFGLKLANEHPWCDISGSRNKQSTCASVLLREKVY